TVKLWDVATGHEALTLRGHRHLVCSIVFSPDGHRLLSCGGDRTVRVWDATPLADEEDEDCIILRGHSGEVTSVAFNPQAPAIVPDGRHMASAGFEAIVRIWDVEARKVIQEYPDHNWVIYCVACSPNGKHVASASGDGTVRLWDVKTREKVVGSPLQHLGQLN